MIASSVEAWVHWQLVTAPATAAWFGFRVTPVVATQGDTKDPETGGTLPFAVYKVVATESQPFLDFDVPAPDRVDVAIEAYAETYAEAKSAAAAVRAVLHRATGAAFGATVYFSLLQSASDDIAVPVDGKGVPLYAVTQVFSVRIQETL